MIERGLQAVGHETQRVEKITLPRAVPSHEDRQMAELDVDLTDALVVADSDSAQKGSAIGRCVRDATWRVHGESIECRETQPRIHSLGRTRTARHSGSGCPGSGQSPPPRP